MIGREATEPLELGGYRVAQGTTIFMTACVIHRDPRWYDDPDAFRPERWADGLLQRIPRYAYFPFGGGPRICIGNSFALMEAALVLATIARRFRLAPRPRRRGRAVAIDDTPARAWPEDGHSQADLSNSLYNLTFLFRLPASTSDGAGTDAESGRQYLSVRITYCSIGYICQIFLSFSSLGTGRCHGRIVSLIESERLRCQCDRSRAPRCEPELGIEGSGRQDRRLKESEAECRTPFAAAHSFLRRPVRAVLPDGLIPRHVLSNEHPGVVL